MENVEFEPKMVVLSALTLMYCRVLILHVTGYHKRNQKRYEKSSYNFFWFEWILCLDVILDIEPDGGWLSVVSCLSILMGCRIAVIKSFHQRWSFEIQCLFIRFLKGLLFIKNSMGRFLPSKNHFYSKHSLDSFSMYVHSFHPTIDW